MTLLLALACTVPTGRWYGEVSGGALRLPDGQQELLLSVENPNDGAATLSAFWSLSASGSAPVTLTLSRSGGFSADTEGQGALTITGLDSLTCDGAQACAFRYTLAADGDGHSRVTWGGSVRIDWDTLSADTATLPPAFDLSLGATTP